MKYLLSIILTITLGWSAVYAQGKVPASVTSAFSSKFPNVSKVTWDKENRNLYEAEFMMNKKKHSANFTAEGKWLETESEVSFDQLPEKVQQSFTSTHKNKKVTSVEKIETSNGEVLYEIEVKKLPGRGEYVYTADGKLKK
jgi:hypothetical protein